MIRTNNKTEESYDELQTEEGVPDYSKKSEFNKPLQVQTTMNKALQLRGEAMHPAYVNTSRSSDGSLIKENVPDTRESYCNAVNAVMINLAPELNRESAKSHKDKIEELEKTKLEVFNKYAYQDFEAYALKGNDYKFHLVFKGKPSIPEYDAIIRINHVKNLSGEVTEYKGYRNQENILYWNEMIAIYDKILSELQCLVDELNYFKQGSAF
jgi:hypothetical protein